MYIGKISFTTLISLAVFFLLLHLGCGSSGGGSNPASPGVIATKRSISGFVKFDQPILTNQLANTSTLSSGEEFIEKASVWLEKHPEINTETLADGSFLLENVPAGNHRIITCIESLSGQIYKTRSDEFIIEESLKTTEAGTLNLQEAKNFVSGILKGTNGTPIPNASLSLWGEFFTTDSSGRFITPPLPISFSEATMNIENASGFQLFSLPVSFQENIMPNLELTLATLSEANHPPLIQLTTSKTLITPLDQIGFTAIVSDLDSPNNESLELAWHISHGSLATSSNNLYVVWYAPDGDVNATLTVTVTDPTGLHSIARLPLKVGAGGNVEAPSIAPNELLVASGNKNNNITWQTVEGATSYDLYWSLTENLTTGSAIKIKNVTSPFNHDNLSNDVEYYYFIIAANFCGESPASKIAMGRPLPPIPATPSNLVAIAASTSVILTWENVTKADNYNLYWSTTSPVSKANGTKISGVQSPYLHKNLSNGLTYFYVLTAINLGGESVETHTVQGKFDGQPPQISSLSPLNNSYGVKTNSVLQINFDEAVTAHTGYISIYKKDGSLLDKIATTDSNKVIIEGSQVTITLSQIMLDDTSYYALIDTGSFRDAYGHSFVGLQNSDDWHFKTMFAYNETLPWNLQIINASEAWKYSTGEGVTVAVLDSGIDSTHPEFYGQLTPTGADFVNDGTYCQDGKGHGTHVAGTIAAKGNNGNAIGVAPKAKIYAVKVLGLNGDGSHEKSISGIMNAVDYGAKIINMSLGGRNYNPAYEEAVNYAWEHGAIIFAASGNGVNGAGTTPILYPARYSNAIGVGATNTTDNWCEFSNFGSELWFTAPGEGIYSTVPSHINATRFESWPGTSMTTPHVSGVAALVWAKNPSFTAQQILDALVYSAIDLGTDGRDQYYGFGRIDALKALQYDPSMASIRTSVMASNILPPAKSDFSTKNFKPGELFIKLQSGETIEKTITTANLNGLGIKIIKNFKLPDLFLLSVPRGREIEIGKKFQTLSQVIYADLNGIITL